MVVGLCLGLLGASALPVAAAKLVPEGNRNAEQPAVPGGSAKRTRSGKTTFDAKYDKVYQLLKNDGALISKISAVATRYNVDPVHMVGAIVGEHTYNVDAYDRLQTYYVKAVSYLKSDFSFKHNGETVSQFVAREEFSDCNGKSDSYDLWICRENVWDAVFRGKTVDGKSWPNDRFGAVFFQPFYAGQTFGIGQLNPLTALQMTDTVHAVSGFRKLDDGDPQEVYRTIMDPDKSLAYMAAVVKTSIAAYRKIAGFDISANPGLTATLYNLGNPEARAARLAAENRLRATRGEAAKWPEENYYGWLVNDRLDELKALFQGS
ncbi:hypothetical protein NA2_09528 [Nitratireductor pacificus pht-3B]|uniref:DUF1402 family protein n=1 Tax=Nitratireductor pacificus pht-3B TaxID=391937 RepID=K2MP06_9HYPH|nr:hypothetical protein NA2_09528 [Nitratireductor pacificus pht-3B]